ncbi:MAG: hypothetical protein HRU13_06580 [Phycisphaerales bacterium]|nr:hypothetical protein [Phycisphaerales bacterium]
MWDLFGFAGDIGHGYTVTMIDDEIVVSPAAGQPGRDVIVRESSVFVCTLDDRYLFIASRYGDKSPSANVWRIDLEKARTREYALPNDVPTIMEHIHGYSPGVRNRDIGLLTGEGQVISAASTVVVASVIGGTCIVFVILLVRFVRRRRQGHRGTSRSVAA